MRRTLPLPDAVYHLTPLSWQGASLCFPCFTKLAHIRISVLTQDFVMEKMNDANYTLGNMELLKYDTTAKNMEDFWSIIGGMKMRKKKIVLLSIVMAAFLSTGITALAMSCPACEASNVQATCISQGQNLGHSTQTHTVSYSENGVLKHNTCTYSISDDKVSWICPNGHGVVSSMIHHKEIHSDSHCISLDYYY